MKLSHQISLICYQNYTISSTDSTLNETSNLNEAYSTVSIYKHLSNKFPTHDGITQEDA
jgi:hypothetical protein